MLNINKHYIKCTINKVNIINKHYIKCTINKYKYILSCALWNYYERL